MSRSLAQAGTRRVTAGDLTALVEIEAETRTPDGYKGATKTWSTLFDHYAAAEPLFVGEREHRGAIRNVTQYRFTVYADDRINEQMRVVFNGESYNIRGIRRGGPSEIFMDIIAETGLD